MATEKILTVRDLIQSLNKMVKEDPKCLEHQIIYSHDDEGNEYQRVINLPNRVKLENPNQKSYRFLELSLGKMYKKDTNAVVIN